jgi:hypothetical protein
VRYATTAVGTEEVGRIDILTDEVEITLMADQLR